MDVVEVLSFLFMLSTMELGMVSNGTMLCQGPCYPFQSQEYSTENLSQTQQAMLVDLRDYGLVWQREAII
jgi:transcription initiation factor TFIIH subunit 4